MGTVARPSLRLRALIAIALLAGFYLFTIVVALALLGFAGLVVYAAIKGVAGLNVGTLLIIVVVAMPAYLLLHGLASARPPSFEPPGRELTPADAPALFAMLDELALAAKTRAPSRVYLAPNANVGVLQRGGTFGVGATRILVIGVPMLHLLRTSEIRAVLAHELGHFVGSDTQLAGVDAYTHALFLSVMQSTRTSPLAIDGWVMKLGSQASAAIGSAIARFYAKFYFRITRPLSRRQELAADALAAEIVGTKTAVAALEAAFDARLYDSYLMSDVTDAIANGAMPTDLLEGFNAFREGVAKTEEGRAILAQLRDRKTDAFDTHPAFRERIAMLSANACSVEERADDDAPALALVAIDAKAWLSEKTMQMVERPLGAAPLELMAWDDVPHRAFEPRTRERARKLAEALSPMFPSAQTQCAMFAAVVTAIESGGLHAVAGHLEPRLAQVVPHQRHAVAVRVGALTLAALFQGALVEKGARASTSLGAPCLMWTYMDETVAAAQLVSRAFADSRESAVIREWATRLAS